MIILSFNTILDIIINILKNSFITYKKDIKINEIKQIEANYITYLKITIVIENRYNLDLWYYLEKDKNTKTLKAMKIDINYIANYSCINDININYIMRAKEALLASTCGLSFMDNLSEVVNDEK